MWNCAFCAGSADIHNLKILPALECSRVCVIRDAKDLTCPLPSVYAPQNYESPKIYFSAFPTINLKLVLYCEECLESSFPKSLQVAPPLLPNGAFTLKHALFIFSPIGAFRDTFCHHMQGEHIWADMEAIELDRGSNLLQMLQHSTWQQVSISAWLYESEGAGLLLR